MSIPQALAHIPVGAFQRRCGSCLGGVLFHEFLGLLDGQDGTRTGHTAAGAGHAFDQVAVELTGPGHGHQLAALPQALRPGGLHLGAGVLLLDQIGHRTGHAAGDGKAAARSGTQIQKVAFGDRGEVHFLCFKDK